MELQMDLTKILKNAPKGLKLYSMVHGEVELERIDSKEDYPIITSKGVNPHTQSFSEESFTKEGKIYLYEPGECILFPSKDQRDWSKFTAPWYKEEKFDPKTLKPFDKVLVRDGYGDFWHIDLFSHLIDKIYTYKYICIRTNYKFCSPYNDDTKHLIGTTDEVPKFYRYWEVQPSTENII